MLKECPVIPFQTAEEAWLWCCKIRLGGEPGRHFDSDYARPCETLDIYRIVDRLHRESILSDSHLRILVSYGQRLAPPLSFKRVYDYECALWDQALSRLEDPFRDKKIIYK